MDSPARRDVVRSLISTRGDALLVTGLGSPAWDAGAAGDDPRNFYFWGAMGGALAAGLGLALARPDRRVIVLTGDGELMMGAGSLAVVGAQQPGNLGLLVLDNEAFGETGAQTGLSASSVDLAALALASGFREAMTAKSQTDAAAAVDLVLTAAGPVCAVVKVALEGGGYVPVPRDGVQLATRFRAALGIDTSA